MRHTPTPRHHAAAAPLPSVLLLLLLMLPLLPAATAQHSPSRDKDNGDEGGGGGGPYSNMPPQAAGFSAPMVVLLVALIAAFLFVGFFSVYMRRCGRGASPPGHGGITAAALLSLSRQEQRNREEQQGRRGLDPAVVASFPAMRYAEARELRVGGKDAALECAVCLSEFQDDEELRLLPPCSHAFHPDCIGEWLAGHVTCPVCRCNLDPEALAAAEAAAAADGGPGAEERPGHHQVAVNVRPEGAADEEEEAAELDRIGSQRRAVRSRPPLVPRSHSTGHSLASRLDGDLERFTLRLPEHVRREMVAAAGEESLRRTGRRAREARGARSARLGRSDRWPSLIARTLSSRVPFWAASRRAPDAAEAGAEAPTTPTAAARTSKREKADGSVTPPKGSVRFDCLGGVGGGGGAVSGARVGAAAGDSEAEEDDDDEEKAIARRV